MRHRGVEVDRLAIGFVVVGALVSFHVHAAPVAEHLEVVVDEVVADRVVGVDVERVRGVVRGVDVSLDDTGGDACVGQVVELVLGDQRVSGVQQRDAACRGVVGADVVNDVVRNRVAGGDFVRPDRVAYHS